MICPTVGAEPFAAPIVASPVLAEQRHGRSWPRCGPVQKRACFVFSDVRRTVCLQLQRQCRVGMKQSPLARCCRSPTPLPSTADVPLLVTCPARSCQHTAVYHLICSASVSGAGSARKGRRAVGAFARRVFSVFYPAVTQGRSFTWSVGFCSWRRARCALCPGCGAVCVDLASRLRILSLDGGLGEIDSFRW